MKKVITILLTYCILLALPSCIPFYPSLDAIPTTDWWNEYSPSIEAFQYNENCPRVCWLGIHPGTTSRETATEILKTTNHIEQSSLQISERKIVVNWYDDIKKKSYSIVTMYLDNGTIESIHFSNMQPFLVENIVELLGNPADISMELSWEPDAIIVVYRIHFSEQNAEIIAYPKDIKAGPNPEDLVQALFLNTDFDYENTKPWLGYGHTEKYLTDSDYQLFLELIQ